MCASIQCPVYRFDTGHGIVLAPLHHLEFPFPCWQWVLCLFVCFLANGQSLNEWLVLSFSFSKTGDFLSVNGWSLNAWLAPVIQKQFITVRNLGKPSLLVLYSFFLLNQIDFQSKPLKAIPGILKPRPRKDPFLTRVPPYCAQSNSETQPKKTVYEAHGCCFRDPLKSILWQRGPLLEQKGIFWSEFSWIITLVWI